MTHVSHDKITRDKIFSTAAHLFAQKGYNGVSMREISERSEVSKPTIYYYFGSKEGIFRQLMDASVVRMFTVMDEIAQMPISNKEKLVAITKNFFKEAQQHPEFVKFFLNMSIVSPDAAIVQKCMQEAAKRGNMLTLIISQGISSGEFGQTWRPELAASIIGGAMQHFIWQQLASKKKILSDQLAEEIIELIFKGLNE